MTGSSCIFFLSSTSECEYLEVIKIPRDVIFMTFASRTTPRNGQGAEELGAEDFELWL